MLLLPALLLMMKIRVGDGWTVVCSKKRQNKKSLKGKNDLGKGGFFNSGKEKRSEKERKGEELCKESKDFKEAFFQEDRSLRSGPKSVSPKKTPLSYCCAGPTPVKSGFVVAGPSFEDGFNLPGAVDLPVRVVRNAQDNQEEPVMGDTPPGPGPAGFLIDSHETVSGDGILAVPVFAGSRRSSDLHEKLSCDGTLAVPAASGSWRCSDQHGKLSADGLFATPGFAGLRGRRASRAAGLVQISENSFNRSGKRVNARPVSSLL